jgi:hypothetical protein
MNESIDGFNSAAYQCTSGDPAAKARGEERGCGSGEEPDCRTTAPDRQEGGGEAVGRKRPSCVTLVVAAFVVTDALGDGQFL